MPPPKPPHWLEQTITRTLSARPVATAAAATVRLVAPEPPIWSTLCDQTGCNPMYSANSMLWEYGMWVIRPSTWSFVSPASSTQFFASSAASPTAVRPACAVRA